MELAVSTVFRKTNEIYRANKHRQIISMGGSRSGKSYSILQLFVILLMERKNFKITVWRNEKVVCRATVLEDFRNIIYSHPDIYNRFIENKAQATFTCKKTGSRIIFEGADSVAKVLGMYQDISFFNEVTEFLESVYDQITQRTSEHIFVDYNPSKKFWLDKYKNNPNTILIHSTYKDNPFLSQGIIDKIESYNPAVERNVELQTADDYMWKVYGLGTLAEKPNRIYKGWRTCSKTYYKDLEYQEYFGLDFGLSNPTALIGVKWDGHRTFYIHEYLYMPSSFMNMPIYKWIQEKIPDVTTNNLVIADSAKQSMVDDMAGAGFLCVGAIKGAGSVDFGINILQSFNVVYTESSHNLDEEYVGYSYMVDRYGLTTDAVVRKDDHLLDALRYCVTYLQKYLDIKI